MPVKHRRYQPQEVIELTRAAIHAFTSRDMAGFDGLLDPDFSFVGDDAPPVSYTHLTLPTTPYV